VNAQYGVLVVDVHAGLELQPWKQRCVDVHQSQGRMLGEQMAAGFQRVNAFTGPADQCRQDSQWQYPIPVGSPETSNSTSPQKQRAVWIFSLLMIRSPM
jgi:hypothetical protein